MPRLSNIEPLNYLIKLLFDNRISRSIIIINTSHYAHLFSTKYAMKYNCLDYHKIHMHVQYIVHMHMNFMIIQATYIVHCTLYIYGSPK